MAESLLGWHHRYRPRTRLLVGAIAANRRVRFARAELSADTTAGWSYRPPPVAPSRPGRHSASALIALEDVAPVKRHGSNTHHHLGRRRIWRGHLPDNQSPLGIGVHYDRLIRTRLRFTLRRIPPFFNSIFLQFGL